MKLDNQFLVRNPRTGKYDFRFKILQNTDIEVITNKLRENQHQWLDNGIEFRIKILEAWKKSLETNKDEIIEALAQDTGRYSESVFETNFLLSSIDKWCEMMYKYFPRKKNTTSPTSLDNTHQKPILDSLVGVISPWNFPLLWSFNEAIHSLLTGFAVVVKPSEVTPRFVVPLMKSIQAVPELEAVLQCISGDGEVGNALISLVDVLYFTGRAATGKKISAVCKKESKTCFLELGRKDPVLIFDGADLEAATSALIWGSTVNTGSNCLSIERVYVQNTIFDSFLNLLIEKTERLKYAYPTVQDGQIGPVISEKQVEILDEHFRDAFEKGAELHTGRGYCEYRNGGYYCFPTILTNVNHSMKIMTEETFGLILPIMSFDTEKEALQLANDSIFELNAAVFADSHHNALQIGLDIEAKFLSINDPNLETFQYSFDKSMYRYPLRIGGKILDEAAMKSLSKKYSHLLKKRNFPPPNL